MIPNLLAASAILLLGNAALAAPPALVQPTPVVLPGDPLPASAPAVVPETRSGGAAAKPARKQARVTAKSGVKAHAAKKVAKAKPRKNRRA